MRCRHSSFPRRVYGVALGLAVLVSTAACERRESPTGPDAQGHPHSAAQVNDGALPQTTETISERLADRIPSFGGAFIQDGVLHIFLTDTSNFNSSRTIVTSELAAVGRASLPVRAVQSARSFAQLRQWREQLRSLLSLQGVAWSEIDERRNEMRIGVTDDAARTKIAEQLKLLRIPSEAVEIVTTTQSVSFSSLRDKFRPLRAGTQILGAYDHQDPENYCTYGINVTNQNDSANRYVVTAAHCVQADQGAGVIGANMYQPVFDPFL